jgi:hypothetical protein
MKSSIAVYLIASLLLSTTSALTGCSNKSMEPDSPGQTAGQLRTQLSQIEGIEVIYLENQKYYNGLQAKTSTLLSLKVEEGYFVSKPKDFVRYLLKSTWSVNTSKPNEYISVTIDYAEEPTHDWQTDAEALGYDVGASGSTRSVTLSSDEATVAFGHWPGPNQALPIEALVIAR